MARLLVNVGCFQAGWFGCILGAAAGWPAVGPLLVVLLAPLSLWLSPRPRVGVVLAVVSSMVGYLADSALVLAGLMVFPEHAVLGWPSPVWMVALWANLALTLDVSLAWLQKQWPLAALLGAVAGPLAYAAGARLGAVELQDGWIWAVALEWLLAMPLLCLLARRLAAPRTPHE